MKDTKLKGERLREIGEWYKIYSEMKGRVVEMVKIVLTDKVLSIVRAYTLKMECEEKGRIFIEVG